jgi:hypothetical protein
MSFETICSINYDLTLHVTLQLTAKENVTIRLQYHQRQTVLILSKQLSQKKVNWKYQYNYYNTGYF